MASARPHPRPRQENLHARSRIGESFCETFTEPTCEASSLHSFLYGLELPAVTLSHSQITDFSPLQWEKGRKRLLKWERERLGVWGEGASIYYWTVFSPKSLLQLCLGSLSPLLIIPPSFLLPQLSPNLNTIISPMTDSSFRNVIWLVLWFRGRFPKAGSYVPGETLSTIFLHVCHSVYSVLIKIFSASLLISTSLPGETFPFVMTHVHHLWASFGRYIFMWIEVKKTGYSRAPVDCNS